jgi:hypothetical protein
MKVSRAKQKPATLQKLKNLLEDDSKKVQGVYYMNSHFSKRYLARAHTIVDRLDVQENEIKMTVSSRVERAGLMELANTLDTLVQHNAGDLPGFQTDVFGNLSEEEIRQQGYRPDLWLPGVDIYNVDILLTMKDPVITCQEFTIAGSKFSLVNIDHTLEDEVEESAVVTDEFVAPFRQTVTLLFGDADKLYFYSNFANKELTPRDTQTFMELIAGGNISGKVFKSVTLHAEELSGAIFPYAEIIQVYRSFNGDYVFGTGSGYFQILREELKNYSVTCLPHVAQPGTVPGSYIINIRTKGKTISLLSE